MWWSRPTAVFGKDMTIRARGVAVEPKQALQQFQDNSIELLGLQPSPEGGTEVGARGGLTTF